jgi:hypothetical protein
MQNSGYQEPEISIFQDALAKSWHTKREDKKNLTKIHQLDTTTKAPITRNIAGRHVPSQGVQGCICHGTALLQDIDKNLYILISTKNVSILPF